MLEWKLGALGAPPGKPRPRLEAGPGCGVRLALTPGDERGLGPRNSGEAAGIAGNLARNLQIDKVNLQVPA